MFLPKHTYIVTWELENEDDMTVDYWMGKINRLNNLAESYDFRTSVMKNSQGRPFSAIEDRFSLNHWQLAESGDRYFTYLLTKNEAIPNQIVGSGFFTCNPFFNGQWTNERNVSAYTIDGEADVLLPPFHNLELLMQPTLELQFPDYNWSGETTDFILDPHTAWLLEEKWFNYLAVESANLPSGNFWCQSNEGFEKMYKWQDAQGNHHIGRAQLYLSHSRLKHKLNNM